MSDTEHRDIAVLHVDPFTGILLEPTAPFRRCNIAPNQNYVDIDNASEAVAYCEKTVLAHPHVQGIVNGMPEGLQREFRDDAWVEAESKRRMEQNVMFAEEQAKRNRWDQLLITGFTTVILLVVLLHSYIRFGG